MRHLIVRAVTGEAWHLAFDGAKVMDSQALHWLLWQNQPGAEYTAQFTDTAPVTLWTEAPEPLTEWVHQH